MLLRADRHPPSATSPRDTVLGGGLVAAFSLLVACTVWSLGYTGSVDRIAMLVAPTMLVAVILTRQLWRPRNERLLLLFPISLYIAEVALAALTNGVSQNYSGFFALAIIYVGLTQQRSVVPKIVLLSAPCWLYCQERLTAPILVRFCIASSFWMMVGVALATRSEISRKRTAELLDRANKDALTGLASRLYLCDQIDRALSNLALRRQSTLLLIDLDGFKTVNDTFGHAVGDDLLLSVADLIRETFRPGDTCARLGGDEFAVLLHHSTVEHASAAAARLLEKMAVPVELPRGQMTITASIGIAGLDDAADSQQVLHDADLAMYDAKAGGRNRTTVFQHEMGERRAARLRLEAELRDALEHEQFELYYQPFVHLQTGTIIGTEALLRWNHPRRGLLAPDQFLDASEEIGVIVTLGDWILRQACNQAVRWQPTDPAKAMSMAVNVSSAELLAADFVQRVADALRCSGLPGRLLILEITERLIVDDVAKVRRQIVELQHLGVRIAIDDFGTGYSSIAYLRELPIDIIKIDQRFVRPLTTDSQAPALLKAMVGIADALQLGIIVEGVETADHVRMLTALGCEVAQGYHFARPASAEAITAGLSATELVSAPVRQPRRGTL